MANLRGNRLNNQMITCYLNEGFEYLNVEAELNCLARKDPQVDYGVLRVAIDF
jgi:hypothetical protein